MNYFDFLKDNLNLKKKESIVLAQVNRPDLSSYRTNSVFNQKYLNEYFLHKLNCGS